MASVERPGADFYVFREARRAVPTTALRDDLDAALDALARAPRSSVQSLAVEALLSAGEIECLLADHASPRAAAASALTDRLAELALGARIAASPPRAPADLVADLPPTVRPSPPEGFVYYALQPDRFAEITRGIDTTAAAVIGIRTIGATLSAIVAASLRLRGARAERATARPTGHPYDRALRPTPDLAAWIAAQRARDAAFLVVDEGPGMSGSSFLAVAEALAREGVDPRRITLLGSRPVDPRELLAERAAERYAAFAGLRVAPPHAVPDDAIIDVSAGTWRARFWADESQWPATWPAHERVKRLSADGRRLYKFEGLGRWGATVRQRARAVADAGFGPAPRDAGGGFTCYPMLPGRPLSLADRAPAVVDRLADYCAFRAAALAIPAADADSLELQRMVRADTELELGAPLDLDLDHDLDLDLDLALPIERPVIADARLHPHEWIASPDGRLLKVDAAAHGDDHLFPGPTDIAWDLAGAIVEWDLEGPARRAFLDRYARASGDAPEPRLAAYLTAYLVLSLARARMAAGALMGTPEATRLERDAARYQHMLMNMRCAGRR